MRLRRCDVRALYDYFIIICFCVNNVLQVPFESLGDGKLFLTRMRDNCTCLFSSVIILVQGSRCCAGKPDTRRKALQLHPAFVPKE